MPITYKRREQFSKTFVRNLLFENLAINSKPLYRSLNSICLHTLSSSVQKSHFKSNLFHECLKMSEAIIENLVRMLAIEN